MRKSDCQLIVFGTSLNRLQKLRVATYRRRQNMDEFYGTMKITPKYAKCDPLFVKGHWVKKDTGKPFMVWCDE